MNGKMLRGITGGVQPLRLHPGYQDAVFAWSGENPFANLAQSSLYRILPRTQYSDSWIKSTPYGKALRADTYSGSGHGYVFSSHVPSANVTYAAGVTGYAEFVYTEDILTGQSIQHLCAITSSGDGNTGNGYYGVLALGFERLSGAALCPAFRVGDNTALYGFAGGTGSGMVPVSIPVGTKIRQMVTFNPVSKAYSSIFAFNDSVYEVSGTVPRGFASAGSSILVGGYPRYDARAAYSSGMLEAVIWNRAISPAEMRALLQRPSIFQPTEFIFPFSFGESSTDNLINIYPSDLSLNSSVLSALQEHSIEPRNLSLSSNPLSTLSAVDILRGSVDINSNGITLAQQVLLTPGSYSVAGNGIELSRQILLNPSAVDLTSNDIDLSQQVLLAPGTYTVTGNGLTTQLYIDITKGSVVTQGKSVLIDAGYPSISIDITQGNIALLGSNILTNTNINVSPSSVTSSGNQVNIARYIEILAGSTSMVGSNIYIDTDFPYLNIDITPSNISTLGNQIILNRVANLVINKGDISTLGSNILVHTQADNLINITQGKIASLGSNILVHTQADNLINIAYGSIEVLGSGVIVISGEPYDSGRRLVVTKQDYRLRVDKQDYVLRLCR